MKPADFFVGQKIRYNPEFIKEASQSHLDWVIWAKDRFGKEVHLTVKKITMTKEGRSYITVHEENLCWPRFQDMSLFILDSKGRSNSFDSTVFQPAEKKVRTPIEIPEGGE